MFLEMLRDAASQTQIPSPLGRFLEQLALFLDAVASSSFLQARRNQALVGATPISDQVLIAANGTFFKRGGKISYDGTSGIFTLQPGTYELRATVGANTFSDANGFFGFVWGNADDPANEQFGSVGKAVALTTNSQESPNPEAVALLDTRVTSAGNAPLRVALVVAGNTGGLSVTISPGAVALTIKEIN